MIMPRTSWRAVSVRKWLQLTLWAIAIGCLGWVAGSTTQAFLFDRNGREDFRRIAHSGQVPSTLAPGSIVGILDIPRLGFSEIVAEGDAESTLKVAIGHLPDTPLPWEAGNSALAGHRDGRFRALKDLAAGDRLRLETHHGILEYVVRETHIVDPDDVWVLNPSRTRMLTLITCHPFDFIGPAPRRYVIMADAVAGAESGRARLTN
jgi:LPXTG-site transpeptidase (sortase) family protein